MPRLPLVTSKAQVAPEHHGIFDDIVQSRGLVHGPLALFLHCPPLAGRLASLGSYVRFEASIELRLRVIAAMVVAQELDAIFIWGAQVEIARREHIPEATINAIREKRVDGMPSQDAQIVEFVRDLVRKHRVGAATMKDLRERFGDSQLIELTTTIGYYSMLAMTANACELEAAPGTEALRV